jgi:DNA invertase Pin-like site-specific DNA recombinase
MGQGEHAMKNAVAYYRTSSATNVGGDSETRQRSAVAEYAAAAGYYVHEEFYDAAVSGADPIDTRPGFVRLLAYCETHGIKNILVENASRFARDLMVQMVGHELLQRNGIELIPVDAPTYFADPTPTAVMVRQIIGAVAQFEKAQLVHKLKAARDRKRAATGRCEGRKPVDPRITTHARKLHHDYPKASLRTIASLMLNAGYAGPGGKKAYGPSSIRAMLRGHSDMRDL